MPSSSGPSRRIASPRQAALVRAIAETGTPTVAVAMRTPWDAVVYPPGVPAIATYSILPDSLEALARALAGEIGFPGRLPVAVPADRPGPDDASATRSANSRRSRRASSPNRPTPSSRSPGRCAAGRRGTSSSPPAARPTMPRSTRNTCSASGTGGRSVSGRHRSCRSTERRRTCATRSSSASASRGRRPTSSRSSPRPGPRCPDDRDHQRARFGAGGRRGPDDRAGRRPGTGDRRDQDLHRRAARDRSAVGGAHR